mmetsp:Transcript_125559/g.366781  ORF Transcript_125559/g.366781 Transcript_125559/m.366781 type:complete len:110 (+) Transcript_125559:1179-1508(+)
MSTACGWLTAATSGDSIAQERGLVFQYAKGGACWCTAALLAPKDSHVHATDAGKGCSFAKVGGRPPLRPPALRAQPLSGGPPGRGRAARGQADPLSGVHRTSEGQTFEA